MDAFRGHVLDLDFPARKLRVHRSRDLHSPEDLEWLSIRREGFLAIRAVTEVDGAQPLTGWFAMEEYAGLIETEVWGDDRAVIDLKRPALAWVDSVR